MTAQGQVLAILDRWIDKAHERGKGSHQVAFWIARDVVEGKLEVTDERRELSLSFIRDECKASPERDAVIAAMTAKGTK